MSDELEHEFGIGFRTSLDYAARIGAGLFMGPTEVDPVADTEFSIPDVIKSPAQERTYRRLQRFAPNSVDHYLAVLQLLAMPEPAPAFVSHVTASLRELDSALREVMYDLVSRAPGGDLIDGKTTRPSHREQIDAISVTFGLNDECRAVWNSVGPQLHKYTHRPGLGKSRQRDAAFDQMVTDFMNLTDEVVDNLEGAYGKVIESVDDALRHPDRRSAERLFNKTPRNEFLWDWIYASMEDPAWVGLMISQRAFDDPPAAYISEDGSLIAPAWGPSRVVARLSPEISDRDTLLRAQEKVLQINNPRIHSDTVYACLRAGIDIAADIEPDLSDWLHRCPAHSEITRLIGDSGVLRFPELYLRLLVKLALQNPERVKMLLTHWHDTVLDTSGAAQPSIFFEYCLPLVRQVLKELGSGAGFFYRRRVHGYWKALHIYERR